MNSNFKHIFRRRLGARGLWVSLLAFICAAGLASAARAASFSATSRALSASDESYPNGAIDPGETNVVSFVFKNTTGSDLKEVKATLVASGNVQFSLSGTVTVGNIPKDASATVSFKFRAGGSLGQLLTPTLSFSGKESNDAAFGPVALNFDTFVLGERATQNYGFSNTAAIAINDFDAASDKLGRASTYPSKITVSGVPNAKGLAGERVSKVVVTLKGLNHPFSQDVNVLLKSPKGNKIALLRNVGGTTGGSAGVTDATLVFSTSGTALGQNAQIPTGTSTVLPTVFGAEANLPSAAPAGPYSTNLGDLVTTLNSGDDAVDAANPNGDWELYVQDDTAGDSGSITGGWSLDITTTRTVAGSGGQTFPYITQLKDGQPVAALADIEVNEDAANIVVPFTAKDLETAEGDISFTVSSSDEFIIKAIETFDGVNGSNYAIGAGVGGENHALTIKKLVANSFGTVNVTITATDASGKSSSATVKIKVNSVNDAPTFPSFVRNQQFNKGATSPELAFTVGDVETSAGDLIVTGTSSDLVLVPNANIILGGSGANRTVVIIPANNGGGTAVITLTVKDGNAATTSKAFTVNFNAEVGDPTISPIDAVTTDEDKSKDVTFTIRSGTGGSVSSLVLSASSSNQDLLPVGNIVFSGTGNDRTATLTPLANISGTTTVGVKVTDPNNTKFQIATFTFTVNAVNDKPTITSIASQVINEDSNTGDLAFTVGDVETAAGTLTVSGTSSNPAIVPNGNITFGGSGANRLVKVTPLANAYGKVTITVSVNDGTDTTSTSFLLTINGVNDDPTILQTIADNDGGKITALAVDTTPVAAIIAEDIATEVVDSKTRVVQQSIKLDGITAGAGDETEQTVTITVSVDNSALIESFGFGENKEKVKSPTVQTVLNYRPKLNAYGTATFTIVLTDNALDGIKSITRKFKIQVDPVNDTPTLADIANQATASNKQGYSIPINLSDVETSVANLTVTATSSDQSVVNDNKITIDGSHKTIAILPEIKAGVNTATITVTATDRGPIDDNTGAKLSVTKTFTVTYDNSAVNQPPTVTPAVDALAIDEDGVASTSVAITDDEDASTVVPTATSSNQDIVPSGSILFGGLVGGSRSVAIIPKADANGLVTITVYGTDRNGNGLSSAPKTITVTVRPVEDNPVLTLKGALTGTITANEDANPVKDGDNLPTIEVTDAETAGDSLAVTATSDNTALIPNANIVISSTGKTRTVTLTPAANKNGSAVITVKVTDGAGRTDTKTFNVTINSVNDAPELAEIASRTISEDATLQTINLTGIKPGGGEAGQTLTVTVTSDNTGLIPTPAITYTSPNETGTLTFTPVADKFGTAKIKVTVKDDGGTSNGGTDSFSREFTVTVSEGNDAPAISNLVSAEQIVGSGTTSFGPTSFVVTDVETPSEQLAVSFTSSNTTLVSNDANGLQATGSGPNRGLIIRPNVNVSGTSDITVTVTDKGDTAGANIKSSSKTFKFTVQAGVKPLITSVGDLVLPVNTFSDILSVTVTDPQSAATALTLTASSDNTAVIPNGNIQFSGNGSVRQFIVKSGATPGSANITLTVKDPDNNTSSTTFKVSVLGSAPTITTIADQSIPQNGSTTPQAFTVNDVETFPGFLTVSASSSDTTVVPNANILVFGNSGSRTIKVTPAADKSGTVTITVTVTDTEGQTGTTSFKVNITPTVNNVPTITSIASQSLKQNTSSGVLAFTVGDTETAAGSLTVTASSSNTAVVTSGGIFLGGAGSASRTVLITPVNNGTGTTTITLTVTDAGNMTASTSFTVTVAPASVANNKNDFNGDGKTDIVFEDNEGFLAVWYLNGLNRIGGALLDPSNVGDPNWRIVGGGDFNADGKADLLFQHANGDLAVWFMDGTSRTSAALLSPSNPGDAAWHAVATADMNKDGKQDILFQNDDGTIAVWYMDGITQTGAAIFSPNNGGNPAWKLVGAGKINTDADMDLFFQNVNGDLAAWFMNGTTRVAGALLSPSNIDPAWHIVGVIDIDGNGTSDLLFQHDFGTLAAWFLSGTDQASADFLNPSDPFGTWRVVAP